VPGFVPGPQKGGGSWNLTNPLFFECGKHSFLIRKIQVQSIKKNVLKKKYLKPHGEVDFVFQRSFHDVKDTVFGHEPLLLDGFFLHVGLQDVPYELNGRVRFDRVLLTMRVRDLVVGIYDC
jgi:hypothetical protein